MSFFDAPSDSSCLSGSTDGSGKKLGFTLHLVGIVGLLPGAGVQDTGIGFSYTTTFNGTSGGIKTRNGYLPADPGSGTGGITVTAFSPTASYQYPKGLGVVGINGQPIVQGANSTLVMLRAGEASVTSSGLVYSRATGLYSATLSLTNVGTNDISGPLQIVLDSLSPGVALTNSSGVFGGWPYISLGGAGSLAPGQTTKVSVSFKNTSNGPITFSPIPYSGSFN